MGVGAVGGIGGFGGIGFGGVGGVGSFGLGNLGFTAAQLSEAGVTSESIANFLSLSGVSNLALGFPSLFPETRLDPVSLEVGVPTLPGVGTISPAFIAPFIAPETPLEVDVLTTGEEAINPFLSVLATLSDPGRIFATQPRRPRTRGQTVNEAVAGTILAALLEALRRWLASRALDQQKRAQESLLSQQAAQQQALLAQLQALFRPAEPVSREAGVTPAGQQPGGSRMAFDVGGFFGGVRDVLTTPGNLQSILTAFGRGPQFPGLPAPPGLPLDLQRFISSQPQIDLPFGLPSIGGMLGQAFGDTGGGELFQVRQQSMRALPVNRIDRMGPDGKVHTWLRAVPRGWTIVGAGRASVSKARRHHHHGRHHPH
ncbi:MAG: hypothetical protein V3T33_09880 [Myxococcota bacterium]